MRIKSNWVAFVFLLGACLFLSRLGHSDDYWVNRSTNVTGEATGFTIPECRPGDMLGSLIINTRASSGTAQIFLSSGSFATGSSLGLVQLSSGATANRDMGGLSHQTIYNLRISSGITFTKSGFADITILWKQQRGS